MNRTEIEDRNQDMGEFVQNELTIQELQQEILKEFVMNLLMVKNYSTKIERLRDELADGSKIGAEEHERFCGEVSDGSKVETR